jgi:hypothetical protein
MVPTSKRRGTGSGPYRHFGKLDLVDRSVVHVIIALVAQITAVVLLHLLLAPSSASAHIRANSFVAEAPASNHASLLFIVVAKLYARCSDISGSLEVLGSYRRRDRRRVCSLDIWRIGYPPSSSESGIVENRGVDCDQPVTYAIFDVCKIRSPELVEDKSACK